MRLSGSARQNRGDSNATWTDWLLGLDPTKRTLKLCLLGNAVVINEGISTKLASNGGKRELP